LIRDCSSQLLRLAFFAPNSNRAGTPAKEADPIGYLTLAETGIKGSPLPRQPEQLTAITGRWSIGPPHYRNTSAMMAAIKPNVASQLTVPINSSVMRPCSPAISDGA